MVSLKKVVGFDGKYNDLVFCGEDAMQHVLFFPGDVQVCATALNFIILSHCKVDWAVIGFIIVNRDRSVLIFGTMQLWTLMH